MQLPFKFSSNLSTSIFFSLNEQLKKRERALKKIPFRNISIISTTKFEILDACRHLDCDAPTCSSIVSYFARTLLRSVFRVAIPWRHGGEETRSQRCASRLAKTGNYRVFREVAMRRRNECHPGIMSSITIFM